MKNKFELTEIIDKAKTFDANKFAKFLDENKIEWQMLDCNIMDYNDGDFNITLDDYDDANIYFLDGQYFEN
jgi:hypothetical protein